VTNSQMFVVVCCRGEYVGRLLNCFYLLGRAIHMSKRNVSFFNGPPGARNATAGAYGLQSAGRKRDC
jgi:hypothetical protein